MVRHARRAFLVVAVLTLVGAVVPTATMATFPGENGRITFMRFDSNDEFQVWVANPDLTHQVQLTFGPGSDAWFPSWSPDGTRIAFSSHRADPDPTDDVEISDIYTMRADGTDIRKLTDSNGFNGNPSWSPDGRWLAFSADRREPTPGQRIYIMPSDGSGVPRRVTNLIPDSLCQELARFSPDGRRLVFNEFRTVEGGDESALFTVRVDGSKVRRITPWSVGAMDADWSPDGRRIVFAGRPADNGFIQDVGVVGADGEALRILTKGDGASGDGADFRYQESFNPAWSPDGKKIIFVRASYTDAAGFAQGLQTMNPNGTGVIAVSTGGEHQPDWGSATPLP